MGQARPGKAALAAVSLALVLGGCGSTQTAANHHAVQIALSEYRVTPQTVSVPAGPVTLIVHNFGRLAHNLAITRGGHVAAVTSPIHPGASATLTLRLTSGSYVITSTLFDDQSLGAYATLDVTP
jgi:iron uptake system EfeUOB component EfeO/EfeM